ncbi:MAG: hypothetical protein U0457_06935 [Candidatus Sericytochromatia bacterium]
MFKIKWLCCLEKDSSFVAQQADIFESEPVYYDEYYETLTGIEYCKKCKATYISFMAVEFTIPKIYFHIPTSKENYDDFKNSSKISKEQIINAMEKNIILIEREINNKSIWEWEQVDNNFLSDI